MSTENGAVDGSIWSRPLHSPPRPGPSVSDDADQAWYSVNVVFLEGTFPEDRLSSLAYRPPDIPPAVGKVGQLATESPLRSRAAF